MAGIEKWWAVGERVRAALRGVDREIFVRRTGAGSPLTLLSAWGQSGCP